MRRYLALGRDVIDEMWKELGNNAGGQVGIDAVLLRELLNETAPQNLFNFRAGNRLIGAGTHPGLGDLPEARVFKLLHQSRKALPRAVIGDERAGEAREHLLFVTTAENGSEKGIEKTHRAPRMGFGMGAVNGERAEFGFWFKV